MNCMLTPTKPLVKAYDDTCAPRSETSTSCHSDDDHEDIHVGSQPHGYHYEKLMPQQSSGSSRSSNHKLKNELCRNYLSLGYCPYNDKCQFAHGTAELRQNCDHNGKYKTKKCTAFFREGFCLYGERCNFLHSEPCRQQQQAKWKAIRRNYRELLAECRSTSRLFPES